MTQEKLAELLAGREASELDLLNERQIELFSLISQGTPSHLILSQMDISEEGLAKVKADIRKKLHLKNDIQLLQFAAKHHARRED